MATAFRSASRRARTQSGCRAALRAVHRRPACRAPILDRIRDEIWLKLWGNVCLNPISALTHATLDVICSDPATRALSKAIMLETQAIAETFGVKFRVDVERRIEGARKVGAHKTSMLQDLERGRPMEIDPPGDSGSEMGRLYAKSDPGARRRIASWLPSARKVAGALLNATPDPAAAGVDLVRTRRGATVTHWVRSPQ